jgi:hypothetical protein
MEAIYATEKVAGQTLERFTADVTLNVDAWISSLRKKRDQQHVVKSAISLSTFKVQHALDDAIRTLNQQSDRSPYMVTCTEVALASLEWQKRQVSAMDLYHPVLKVDYDAYLKTLEDVKRAALQLKVGASAMPKVVEFPTLLTTSNPQGGYKQPYDGYFHDFVSRLEPAYPMTLAAYEELLKAQYPSYLALLRKRKEQRLVAAKKDVFRLVGETLGQLRRYDILDWKGYRGVGYLYVFERDGVLCLRPTVGEYGYMLPAEALPMLKAFHVHTHDELERVYGNKADVHGISPTNSRKVELFLADAAEDKVAAYLDGHSLLVSEETLEGLPSPLADALRNGTPLPPPAGADDEEGDA